MGLRRCPACCRSFEGTISPDCPHCSLERAKRQEAAVLSKAQGVVEKAVAADPGPDEHLPDVAMRVEKEQSPDAIEVTYLALVARHNQEGALLEQLGALIEARKK